MGYTTEFEGRFEIVPPLKPEHLAYLKAFSRTRHMRWNINVIEKIPDPLREAVGLPLGEDGGYFVAKQEGDRAWAIDNRRAPRSQSSLYCQWIPSDDGNWIEWDKVEKFYGFEHWLWYLIENFLRPWGYTLNGEVKWQGEDPEDYGVLVVKDNLISVIDPGEPPFPDYFDEE